MDAGRVHSEAASHGDGGQADSLLAGANTSADSLADAGRPGDGIQANESESPDGAAEPPAQKERGVALSYASRSEAVKKRDWPPVDSRGFRPVYPIGTIHAVFAIDFRETDP